MWEEPRHPVVTALLVTAYGWLPALLLVDALVN
jgi:hypothetical protein